jgi:hypothetical protein
MKTWRNDEGIIKELVVFSRDFTRDSWKGTASFMTSVTFLHSVTVAFSICGGERRNTSRRLIPAAWS